MRPTMNKAEGRRLLTEAKEILDRVGVPHFLIQGTALGAYRDNGFTPTERDIDIGFLQEEFEPFSLELFNEFASRGFKARLVSEPFKRNRSLKVKKNGIKIDMVAYLIWENFRFCSSLLEEYSIVHPRQNLENYETVELFGMTFKVPSPIEVYLAHEYGPDWETPTDTHISASRIYQFRKTEGIPNDLLTNPQE
jgi:phosphorylcholine metabolism protein LicD